MAHSSQGTNSSKNESNNLKCKEEFFDPDDENLAVFGDDFGSQALDIIPRGGGVANKIEDDPTEMDISRGVDFYNAADVDKISNKLAARLFYHPDQCSFMIFFRKLNDLTKGDCSDHSHMSVNPDNIRSLWKGIQLVCDEVELTAFDKIPKSHEGEAGKILNKDLPEYWSIAQWTKNELLAVRSYKTDSGYLVRIMMKRPPSPNQRFPTWIGRSMSLKISEARAFVEVLKKYDKLIKEADQVRIEVAKIKQAEREKMENRAPLPPGFDHISPAPSP